MDAMPQRIHLAHSGRDRLVVRDIRKLERESGLAELCGHLAQGGSALGSQSQRHSTHQVHLAIRLGCELNGSIWVAGNIELIREQVGIARIPCGELPTHIVELCAQLGRHSEQSLHGPQWPAY